jgi:hypothetical protein
MATLTQSQIYTIALAAGLPNPKVMAAVAMAESSGRTDVVNSIGAVGLWQINQPVHVKRHPTWTVSYLKNPMNNALAAKVILRDQGMDAWEGYTNKAYVKYMGADVQQVDDDPCALLKLAPEAYKRCKNDNQGEPPRPPDGVDDLDALANMAEALGKTVTWVSDAHNWIRIAYVMGGVFITLVGLNVVTRGQLFNALPVGKVTKLAKGATK